MTPLPPPDGGSAPIPRDSDGSVLGASFDGARRGSGDGPLAGLLAHRDWVRRVARALSRDSAEADDLEQQAWLAWLRRPPRAAVTGRPGAVRAWFRAVMRNEARFTNRSAVRRRERETLACAGEAAPPADEAVARAEAHRRVVEAVLALDEPFRTSVVLRHFEGLETGEIARRTGAPADTVRARIRRAHELLRERLDPRGDGRDAPWTLLLLPAAPLADGGAAASLSAEASASAAGGAATCAANAAARSSLMAAGSKSKIAAALALFAAVAGGLFIALSDGGNGGPASRAGGDTGTAGSGAAVAEARQSAGARTSGRPAGPSAVASGGHVGADAASCSGDVRTVTPDAPAAGARVTLRKSGAGTDRDQVLVATTDASGAFSFADLPPGGTWTASAELDPFAPATRAGVRLAAAESRRLGTLRLDAPVAAGVLVVGPDGTPLHDATVEAFTVRSRIERQDWDAAPAAAAATAKTSSGGVAAFPSLSVGAWTFRASLDGFAPVASEPRTLTRGGVPLSVTIRLERGHPLEGTITGVDGRPVAGATVHALPLEEATALMLPRPVDPRGLSAPTDDAGRFRFDRLPSGDHSIALVRAGSLPCRLGNVSVPSVSRFDVRLDGGVLAGRITEEGTGRPLGGARVRAAVWRRHSPTFLSAVTGPDGRYRIDVPLGGALQGPARGEGEAQELPVHFDVDLDGWVLALDGFAAPWRQHFVFGGQEIALDASMRPAATLEGVVTGPAGPVAGASVTADIWSPLRGSLSKTVAADPSGRFRFPGLPEGRARIVAAAPGHVQTPSPGAGWRAQPAPDPAWIVDIPKTGSRTFDIALTAAAPLRGMVTDGAGRPVPAATVSAAETGVVRESPSLPTGSAAAIGAKPRAETATTDASGEFVISSFAAGTAVTVTAEAPGHAGATAGTVVADPRGGGTPLTLVLDELPAVVGRVEADGAPLRDAWVQVAPAAAALDDGYEIVSVWEVTRRQPVRADGTFSAAAPSSSAPAGKPREVVVRAGAPGFAPSVSGRVAVSGPSPDAGTIRLAAGSALRGVVFAADGSGPVAGAEIEFMNEKLPPAIAPRRDWSASGRGNTPFTFVARSASDGTFEVPDLPAWRYELRVGASGHAMATAVAPVPSSEPVRIELARLTPIGGRAEFEDGEPAAGVIVVAHWVPQQPGVAGTGECAPDGSFLLPLLGAGTYRLEARRPWDRAMDVVPTTTGDVEGGTRDVRIVVKRGGGRISGRCVTESGAAVPGASIHARLASAQGPFPFHARSSPDGSFAMTSLEGGPWTLFADASRAVGSPQDFGRVLVAQIDAVELGASGVTLVFRAAAPIRGRVVQEDGAAPPPGLAVSARPAAAGAAPVTLWCPVGADGSFRFDNATAGAWTLAVAAGAGGRAVQVNGPAEVAGGTTDVRLVLPAATGIAGRVVDADGRGVQGASVAAIRPGSALTAWTDAEGRFRLDGAEGAGWTVVSAEHETGRCDDTPAAGGDTSLLLVLRPLVTVEGVVLDASGSPLRGARVTLTAAEAPPGSSPEVMLFTDAEGRFRSRGLRDGTWNVDLVPATPGTPPSRLGTLRNGTRGEFRTN